MTLIEWILAIALLVMLLAFCLFLAFIWTEYDIKHGNIRRIDLTKFTEEELQLFYDQINKRRNNNE